MAEQYFREGTVLEKLLHDGGFSIKPQIDCFFMAKRILISGAISGPQGSGGTTWVFLQYIMGFRRLGFETYYVEFLNAKGRTDDEPALGDFTNSAHARYFQAVMDCFALGDTMILLEGEGPGRVGCLSLAEIDKLAPDIDLLVNLSGRFPLKSLLGKVRRRMYIDLDPGYTQIWQAQYGIDMNLPGHDVYVTVGLNLGKLSCPMPTCGIQWQTTLPPIVLAEWMTRRSLGAAYTTVADWRGYGPVECGTIKKQMNFSGSSNFPDLILVVRNGQIVEQGPFAELMRQQGAFAALYRTQFSEDAEQLAAS